MMDEEPPSSMGGAGDGELPAAADGERRAAPSAIRGEDRRMFAGPISSDDEDFYSGSTWSRSGSKSEDGADGGLEPEAKGKAQSKAKGKAQVAAKGKAKANAKGKAKAKAEAKAQARSQIEAGSEVNGEVGPQAKAQGKSKGQSKSKAQRGTCGTFAGRRPPTNANKRAHFDELKAHYLQARLDAVTSKEEVSGNKVKASKQAPFLSRGSIGRL